MSRRKRWVSVAGVIGFAPLCLVVTAVAFTPPVSAQQAPASTTSASTSTCAIPDLQPYESKKTYELPNVRCATDESGWDKYREACARAYKDHRAVCTAWCGSCSGTSGGTVPKWNAAVSDPSKAHCVEKFQSHGEPKWTAIYVCRVTGGCDCQ